MEPPCRAAVYLQLSLKRGRAAALPSFLLRGGAPNVTGSFCLIQPGCVGEPWSSFSLQGGTWRPAPATGSAPTSLSHWLPPSSARPDSWANTTWWLGVSSLTTCRRNSNSICRSTLARNVWFLFKDLGVLAVKLSWVLWPQNNPQLAYLGW